MLSRKKKIKIKWIDNCGNQLAITTTANFLYKCPCKWCKTLYHIILYTFTCSSTLRRLVSPLPLGCSIPAQLISRSNLPKLSVTNLDTPTISSSFVTSSLQMCRLAGLLSFSCPRSWAEFGLRHVAMTVVAGLRCNRVLQNWSPIPLLAPCIKAIPLIAVISLFYVICLQLIFIMIIYISFLFYFGGGWGVKSIFFLHLRSFQSKF